NLFCEMIRAGREVLYQVPNGCCRRGLLGLKRFSGRCLRRRTVPGRVFFDKLGLREKFIGIGLVADPISHKKDKCELQIHQESVLRRVSWLNRYVRVRAKEMMRVMRPVFMKLAPR